MGLKVVFRIFTRKVRQKLAEVARARRGIFITPLLPYLPAFYEIPLSSSVASSEHAFRRYP